jgi:peptide/nickel transport system ATP-binding protein
MTQPTDRTSAPLLAVRNLGVSFDTENGPLDVVRSLSFDLVSGTTLGIVGESGAGKSVAMQSLLGLAQNAHTHGRALYQGIDLLRLSGDPLRAIRGREIAMIFQNPMSSLHPQYSIGWQIGEMLLVHERISKARARARVIQLLGLVGIPRPERRVDEFPHQYSGGMLQRAMIAMAISLNPRILIADEPTTALDVTVQVQILKLLRRLQLEFAMAIIFVTHDLALLAETAHEVLVMYAGTVMEHSTPGALFAEARHPYTQALLHCRPSLDTRRDRLPVVLGCSPSPSDQVRGCPFADRCSVVMSHCSTSPPPLFPVAGTQRHRSACWHAEPDEQ